MIVGIFVLCGLQGLKVSRSRRTAGNGDFNSSDRFLLEALHANGGAEGIVNSISALPPGEPLAIIAPRDNVYGPLLLQAIGALTWPHEICLVQTDSAGILRTAELLRNDHFAAGLYYDLAPPAPTLAACSDGLLTIVPTSK